MNDRIDSELAWTQPAPATTNRATLDLEQCAAIIAEQDAAWSRVCAAFEELDENIQVSVSADILEELDTPCSTVASSSHVQLWGAIRA